MQTFERPPADPELKRRIQDLITSKGEGHNADLVADIIENALKLMTDVEARGDVRVHANGAKLRVDPGTVLT